MSAAVGKPWRSEDGDCLVCATLAEMNRRAYGPDQMVSHLVVMGGVLAAVGPEAFATAITTLCENHRAQAILSLHQLAKANDLPKERTAAILGVATRSECVQGSANAAEVH